MSALHNKACDFSRGSFTMPLMDGNAMVAAMRANPSFRDIPVIMMSAAPEAALRKRLDGYEAFLRKPFRIGALLEAVRFVFERGSTPKPG